MSPHQPCRCPWCSVTPNIDTRSIGVVNTRELDNIARPEYALASTDVIPEGDVKGTIIKSPRGARHGKPHR